MWKYTYPLVKSKIKNWIKYYIYKIGTSAKYILSEIQTLLLPTTLENTAPKQKFNIIELYGNTFQQTYTGKNLYNANESYSFTQDTAGWIFIDGTRGANGSNIGTKTDLKASVTSGETYSFKVENLTTTASAIQLVYGDETLIKAFTTTTIKEGYTFTSAQTGVVLLRIYAPANDNISISKVILVASSTIGDWEPYVGNQPSPSPSYPQNIEVVTGENSVKIENKNVWKMSYLQSSSEGTVDDENFTITNNSTDVYLLGYYSTSAPALFTIPKGTYKFSSNNSNVRISLYYVVNNTLTSFDTNFDNTTISDDVDIVAVRARGSSSLNGQTFGLQLEKGTTATSYVPHQEQNSTIDLDTIELCKIGDYQDYIYKNGNNWYKKTNIGKVVLDGTETSWVENSGTPGAFQVNVINVYDSSAGVVLAISNYLKGIDRNFVFNNDVDNAICTFSSNRLYLRCSTYVNNLAGFKSWMSNHNITVYYVLATPTDTQITDSTLIEQLEELEKAKTYEDTTNISYTGDLAPYITVQYYMKGDS